MKTLLILLLTAAALQADSLLTRTVETPAQIAARQVLEAPKATRDAILGQYGDAFSRLWDAPDPQAVLDAMGTDAGKVFAINTKFAALLGALMTEEGDQEGLTKLGALLAKIKPFTINEDGTVTLTVVVPPVPEPTPTPEPTPESTPEPTPTPAP